MLGYEETSEKLKEADGLRRIERTTGLQGQEYMGKLHGNLLPYQLNNNKRKITKNGKRN